MEVIFGSVIVAGWLVLVLWGVWRAAVAAARRRSWPPSAYITGMLASAAIGAGLVLAFKWELPDDVFGAGVVLASVGGVALWLAGASVPEKTATFFDDPIFTEDGELRPPGQCPSRK